MKDLEYSRIKEGLYAIEENGQVWSKSAHKYMKTKIDKDGYLSISLRNRMGGYSSFGIHRLMMIAFNPIEDMEKLTINHIDGNKHNNSLDNLEWCSDVENTHKAWVQGLHMDVKRGESHPLHKINEEEAKLIIELLKQGKTHKEILLLVPNATTAIVKKISNKSRWKHLW